MSYNAQQIEKGKMNYYNTPGEKKFNKKAQNRKMRRKMRQYSEFTPQYNRYTGGWTV